MTFIRAACSITDSNSVVITGGYDDNTIAFRVSRYNIEGWMEDLPRLTTRRWNHACALYTTDTGAKV